MKSWSWRLNGHQVFSQTDLGSYALQVSGLMTYVLWASVPSSVRGRIITPTLQSLCRDETRHVGCLAHRAPWVNNSLPLSLVRPKALLTKDVRWELTWPWGTRESCIHGSMAYLKHCHSAMRSAVQLSIHLLPSVKQRVAKVSTQCLWTLKETSVLTGNKWPI